MRCGWIRRLAWLAGGDGARDLGACSAHAAGAGGRGGSNPGTRRPRRSGRSDSQSVRKDPMGRGRARRLA